MPLGYRAGLDLTKLKESYLYLKDVAATNQILMPSGSGVTLPQPETSDVVRKWNEGIKGNNIANDYYRNNHHQKETSTNNNDDDNDKLPQIIISTPSEFFNSLEKHLKMKIEGEGIGCGRQEEPQERTNVDKERRDVFRQTF